jgi:hypothetical protein
MTVQKKLWPCFDKDFWKDVDRSVSFLVRDLITGRDVVRLAKLLRDGGVEKCSDSLLYKWANPTDERLPSLKAFLLLIKICEDCGPVASINEACGSIAVPNDNFLEGIKSFTAQFEQREALRRPAPPAGHPHNPLR